MLKKLLCVICIAACVLSLFACSAVEYPADVSAVDGFKCVYSEDDETNVVIEGENAKKLYKYIAEQWEKSNEAEADGAGQARIYLSFRDEEENFYGVFWIYENDYMVFTATNETSFQKYYELPAGTYEKLSEMIEK